jgi:hypothetical protein
MNGTLHLIINKYVVKEQQQFCPFIFYGLITFLQNSIIVFNF